MKTNIKITRKSNMTTQERDRIILDPNTINLTGEVTSKQRYKNRKINRYKNKFLDFMPKFIAGLVILGGIFIAVGIVNANDQNTINTVSINNVSEKPSGNLCQNLAFSNPERFKKECDIQTVQNIIKEVKSGKYEDIEERAFEVIVKFEGFHDKPYWDYKQWSCGYGMRCNKNTTGITKEKSKWFVMERIKLIREKHKLYGYDDDLEVALISFTYNIGHPPLGYRWYIQKGYINGLKNRMKEYSYASGKYLRGLAKRRNFEANLF